MNDYDAPWKDALEHYFNEFMAFFFPVAHKAIDWERGYTFEEAQKMTYITSVERIGIRKGKEEGIRQGLQQGMQEGIQ